MLELKNISKQYRTGPLIQNALNGISLSLRDHEFVSVLGPSGSGKTTLLNIIGGLDCYDSGELLINRVSTKEYHDRDWDTYRNHMIGFVFQSYNLIPHQSVLANVELALTISGISRRERRKRAREALEEVGLGDHVHKRPNQLSGGQMQRVAIARALVNDPEILLADEPTGALDSETSVQIMDLLKEVAQKRLVVMVTHNPELAEQYSTRIVKLRDGQIVDDSDPFVPEPAGEALKPKKTRRAKMGFGTSLALSFNNLRTKKGRTVLTSFAGSIGIIGIALILALSTGVNQYIADIQKETMTSYPIAIQTQELDMSGMMGIRGQMMGGEVSAETEPRTGVYADNKAMELRQAFSGSIAKNDLAAFKKYLDDPESEIREYLGENGVVYSYNISFGVYSYNADGELINTDAETDDLAESGATDEQKAMRAGFARLFNADAGTNGAKNFSEMMRGTGDTAVSAVITDSYELLHGRWPQSAHEIVLVLDEDNAIPTDALYQLGLITAKQYREIYQKIADEEEAEDLRLDYAEIEKHTFYLVPSCDFYQVNEEGIFSDIQKQQNTLESLVKEGFELKVSGVIKPVKGAANAAISTVIGYTSALTDEVIAHTDNSAAVKAQLKTPEINILNGMRFEAADDAQKAADAKKYLSELGVSDKASFYTAVLAYKMQNAETAPAPQGQEMPGMIPQDETMLAAALDQWLANEPDQEILISVYEQNISGSSFEDNMKSFGRVSYDVPDSISIYTDSFEAKESVEDCIAHYNETAGSGYEITYTDYVKLMTSSLTQIINVISYVLIAFVSVSLVVSCLMIGIITHISVLERTKEIGILRALGASKRNISQVFNAETVIIGFCAGLLGVGISALLTIPINSLIHRLVDAGNLSAYLPPVPAIVLVGISVVITVIGGLFPAKKAAKKDPVIALRTE